MRAFLYLAAVSILSSTTQAQFPPIPKGVTTIHSADHKGASLSYKQTFICETTPGVKSYSGYVNLPSTLTGESFNISTFYWYFSARKDPANAPLSIYLAGGAGESSMDGVNGEGGPCNINADSNSTTLNPWSLNNEVNMLYIDQPIQTGFSYGSLINGTFDLVTGTITPLEKGSTFTGNESVILGTFPNQDPLGTTQGSKRGAVALWHFMQVWIDNFPKGDVKHKKLSIWGNSWAGFFVPSTFAYFARQNELILKGKASGCVIPLEVMGTTNGCMDPLIESPHYPEMAVNNTYGFVAYNESVHAAVLEALSEPGGCTDLTVQCRALAAVGDPDYNGKNETVNTACGNAFAFCFQDVQGPFLLSGRSAFDMSHPFLDPFPNYRAAGYFNQHWVQSALGVPVNFTDISGLDADTYAVGVGDAIRNDIGNLEYVLQQGYQVAMIHGDRDHRCSWLGGEAISLAAKWAHKNDFSDSGYASIITNSSYNGGFVRQAGKFSFSRVFQAGHSVNSFQPETVSRIFNRAMSSRDVATGKKCISSPSSPLYHTIGPKVVRNVTQTLPPMPQPECYTLEASSTCSYEQLAALKAGAAVVKDFVMLEPKE